MSFSTIFKRIPSFGRGPSRKLPSVEPDEPSENVYHSAPNSFFEKSLESIPAQINSIGPCAAKECERAGQCYSSSDGEAEEGQCVFSYNEPTSSIFYVSSRAEVSSADELSSFTSFGDSSENEGFGLQIACLF